MVRLGLHDCLTDNDSGQKTEVQSVGSQVSISTPLIPSGDPLLKLKGLGVLRKGVCGLEG